MSREFHQEGQFHRLVKEPEQQGFRRSQYQKDLYGGPFLLYRTHSDNFLKNENQPYLESYRSAAMNSSFT